MPTPIRCFRISDDVFAKAQYVAWFERDTLTNRIVSRLESDIAKFEKQNGEITTEQIKKATKKK